MLLVSDNTVLLPWSVSETLPDPRSEGPAANCMGSAVLPAERASAGKATLFALLLTQLVAVGSGFRALVC